LVPIRFCVEPWVYSKGRKGLPVHPRAPRATYKNLLRTILRQANGINGVEVHKILGMVKMEQKVTVNITTKEAQPTREHQHNSKFVFGKVSACFLTKAVIGRSLTQHPQRWSILFLG
jgi:hypothetical protein